MLKQLESVLKKRLPHIRRWKDVSVYQQGDSFIIHWSGPKGKNFHPYEYKEIPLTDLEKVYEKNRMRLRNETKEYK